MRLNSGLLAFVVCAASVSHNAEASPILFTERAAFEAAAPPDIRATFETLQPTGCTASECSGVVDGVLLVSSNSPLDATGDLTFISGSVTIGVGGPMNAVGFDASKGRRLAGLHVAAIMGMTPTGDLVVENIPLQGFNLPLEGSAFLGLLFPEPIFGLQLRADGDLFGGPAAITVDDIAIQTAVPEPATALLLSLGAMVLVQRRRLTRPT